jgi:hypothetical protein
MTKCLPLSKTETFILFTFLLIKLSIDIAFMSIADKCKSLLILMSVFSETIASVAVFVTKV